MGNVICLTDAADAVHSCDWGTTYTAEKGYTGLYERTLRVPTHAAAGPARVYVNNGAGDFGWSEAALLHVVAPAQPLSLLQMNASIQKDMPPGQLTKRIEVTVGVECHRSRMELEQENRFCPPTN